VRAFIGRGIRRLANWVFRFGDWIEGAEEVARIPFDLEPEHALAALQEAQRKRDEFRKDLEG
jgi:hypothetical protein